MTATFMRYLKWGWVTSAPAGLGMLNCLGPLGYIRDYLGFKNNHYHNVLIFFKGILKFSYASFLKSFVSSKTNVLN